MIISKFKFEEELESLINAAKSTSNKETARRFLIQARNKVEAYSNMPINQKKEYLDKISLAEDKLEL